MLGKREEKGERYCSFLYVELYTRMQDTDSSKDEGW